MLSQIELKMLPYQIILENEDTGCRFGRSSFDEDIRTQIRPGRDGPKSRVTTQTIKGDITMRFMMIVKHSEKQGPPPKALMDAIAKLADEEAKVGTMLGSGGLAPAAQG